MGKRKPNYFGVLGGTRLYCLISQTVCEILITQLFLKSHPIFRGDNNNILVTIPISIDLQHINQQIFSHRLYNLHLRAAKSTISIMVVECHPHSADIPWSPSNEKILC